MTNKFDIFISYRREGGFEVAKHIKDLLERDGYSVSFDLDNLRNGDFNKQLIERITNCKDFILILDAHVFDRNIEAVSGKVKETGDDWLITEIAEALKSKKNIIPIMLDGFTDFPKEMPDNINDVRYKNGPKYDKVYFDAFYERLKNFFDEAPRGYENIGVEHLPNNLVCSLLLEHGWLKYNNGKYDEALEYFLQAAEKGSANAFNAIAIYYQDGHGYEKNPQKSAQWFRYAAEMGYASAQRNLGDCYLKGEGVPENHEEALRWYLRACEKDNAKAQFAVAECYANKKGTPEDMSEEESAKKAFEYYFLAANQGLDTAEFALAECYANGNGCEKNMEIAKEWYEKAALQGNDASKKRLEQFAKSSRIRTPRKKE